LTISTNGAVENVIRTIGTCAYGKWTGKKTQCAREFYSTKLSFSCGNRLYQGLPPCQVNRHERHEPVHRFFTTISPIPRIRSASSPLVTQRFRVYTLHIARRRRCRHTNAASAGHTRRHHFASLILRRDGSLGFRVVLKAGVSPASAQSGCVTRVPLSYVTTPTPRNPEG